MIRTTLLPIHAVGVMPDHEILIVIFPLLVGLLCAVIVAITWLSQRGLLPALDKAVQVSAFVGIVCAGLSIGAGLIHLAVVPDHLTQWWVFGVAFAIAAVVQIAWAGAYVARPGRRLALFGLILNAAIVAIWVVSRTIGLPFGPTAGRSDAIGFVDLVATLLEVALIATLAVGLVPRTAVHLESRQTRFGDASIGSTFSVLVIAIVCAVAITGFASVPPA